MAAPDGLARDRIPGPENVIGFAVTCTAAFFFFCWNFLYFPLRGSPQTTPFHVFLFTRSEVYRFPNRRTDVYFLVRIIVIGSPLFFEN